jgi:hypothetical protein
MKEKFYTKQKVLLTSEGIDNVVISIDKYNLLKDDSILIDGEIFKKIKTVTKNENNIEVKSLIWGIGYRTPEGEFDVYVNEAYEVFLILFQCIYMEKELDDCIFISRDQMDEINKSLGRV